MRMRVVSLKVPEVVIEAARELSILCDNPVSIGTVLRDLIWVGIGQAVSAKRFEGDLAKRLIGEPAKREARASAALSCAKLARELFPSSAKKGRKK